MFTRFVRIAFGGILLAASFGAAPVAADCLGQCESQHQTCLRGCTGANAKECVDSCFRGSSACRSRCRSEAPTGTPARVGGLPRALLHKVCTQLPIRCSANSDCTCSKCCGDMAGVHVCQPSC